jgi:hypothetical protein
LALRALNLIWRHRKFGSALVEQVFDEVNSGPVPTVLPLDHQRRLPMELLLVIVVVLLLFGGGGYWARGRGYW